MDTFTTAAGSVALVKTLVDFIKYLRAKDTNGAITQLTVWVAGISTVLLLRASDFAGDFDVSGIPLSSASPGTVVLAGLGLGSSAMVVNELKKAIDSSDSARKPRLVETSATE